MTKRKGLSKKTRFEVFKRDSFTCQYCGAHPPAAILEVDHIVAVAEGGDNDDTNLVTACFNCNRGKSARSLSAVPQSLADKAAEIAEREEQLRGYSQIMAARRERLEDDVWFAFRHFRDTTSTSHDKFNSMKRFVDTLGLDVVLDAFDIAMGAHTAYGQNAEWRYFCGICWNKIKEANPSQ
jgi:hypothetical protein